MPLSSLSVQVFDGAGTNGSAAAAAAELQALGMRVGVGYGGGYSGYTGTEILYPAGEQAQARALAARVAGAVVRQSDSVNMLTLVVGQNNPNEPTVTPAGPAAPRSPARR
ncbi:hypothetical protein GXW82_18070 [Streptacidiphilus sp. 4-A2]|nr:hypothetical protein [Streptacidiphilus sp. 4-A2]